MSSFWAPSLCHWPIYLLFSLMPHLKNAFLLFCSMSSRARSLFLAPPSPYSHRLHHRVGNTLILSTLHGNCLPDTCPVFSLLEKTHLIQEEKVKPAKEHLHNVFVQLLVPGNYFPNHLLCISILKTKSSSSDTWGFLKNTFTCLLHFWLRSVLVAAPGVSLGAASGDDSIAVVHRLFTAVPSLLAERGALGGQAQLPRGTWNLLRPAIEPVSLAFQGGFLTGEAPTLEVLFSVSSPDVGSPCLEQILKRVPKNARFLLLLATQSLSCDFYPQSGGSASGHLHARWEEGESPNMMLSLLSAKQKLPGKTQLLVFSCCITA